jgi:hypothetical protein
VLAVRKEGCAMMQRSLEGMGMRRWVFFVGVAMLALLVGGGNAQARGSWTFENAGGGAVAKGCLQRDGQEICAALFCEADGIVQFGIAGLSGSVGALQDGDATIGSRRYAGSFINEIAAPLSAPVWRLGPRAGSGLIDRLKRNHQLRVNLAAIDGRLDFSLRSSSRSIQALLDQCEKYAQGEQPTTAAVAASSTPPASPVTDAVKPTSSANDTAVSRPAAPVTDAVKPTPDQRVASSVAADLVPRVGNRSLRAGLTAIRHYQRKMIGRWGTRELCHIRAAWNFQRKRVITPSGAVCERITIQKADGPAVRLIGQNCMKDGEKQDDLTYEISVDQNGMLLTRGSGLSIILKRCR